MEAVAYCRVSTDEQQDNHSLATQLAGIRRYAEQYGLVIVAELQDVESGSKLDRPGLTKARQIIRSGGAKALIVYSQDRLSRSVAHTLLLRDELSAAGCALHAVSRGQSQDTPEGRLMDTMEASFAEFERLKIRERLLRGKAGRASAGKVIGAAFAPYGLAFEGKRREAQIVIVETEAEVIRQIVRWFLEGVSVKKICQRLDALGVPRPCATRGPRVPGRRTLPECTSPLADGWRRQSVYKILRDESIAGVYRYGPTDPVAIPAIIDAETFSQVQAKLNGGRAASPRNARRTYLLKGLIRCSCGRAMGGGTYPLRNGEKVRHYRCAGESSRDGAPRPCQGIGSVKSDIIEGAVWRWVVTNVLDEQRIVACLAELRSGTEDRRAALEAEAASYQRQIASAAEQTAKIIRLYAADILTLEEVSEQKRAINQLKAATEAELSRVQAELSALGGATDETEALAMVRRVKAAVAGEDSDELKQRVLGLLQVKVKVIREEGRIVGAEVSASLTGDEDRLSFVSGDLSGFRHKQTSPLVIRGTLRFAA